MEGFTIGHSLRSETPLVVCPEAVPGAQEMSAGLREG